MLNSHRVFIVAASFFLNIGLAHATPPEFQPFMGEFNVLSGKCLSPTPTSISVSYVQKTESGGDDQWYGEHAIRVTLKNKDNKVISTFENQEFRIEGEGRFSVGFFTFENSSLIYRWSSNADSEFLSLRDLGSHSTFDYKSGRISSPNCDLQIQRK